LKLKAMLAAALVLGAAFGLWLLEAFLALGRIG